MACSSGPLPKPRVAYAQTVFARGCMLKCLIRRIAGAEIAANRGRSRHSSVAKAQAVLDRCWASN